MPTFREATGKAFEAYSWFGLVAPAGTPAPVVNRLETALSAALRDPATLKQLTSSGLEPVNGSSTAFASTISTDLKRWTEAVRSSGVKPD
ncbi:Tripartite tricarboxylate transporter family receptor [compost metagenome]